MTSLQNKYMLCPPLTCNTTRTRPGIGSINRRIRSCGILAYSCSRACCSSCSLQRWLTTTNVLFGSNLVI